MREKKTRVCGRALSLLIASAILPNILLLTSCSEAKGVVEKKSMEDHFGVMNNQPDYGKNITMTVKNVGKADSITINPRLSTSEGEWQRTQTLHFDAGETKTLTYFFHEPTINASNFECKINISPKAP